LGRALKQQVALCENATLNAVWSAAPVHFDERPHTAIHRAAQRLDLPIIDLVSGAGHDAVHVSRVVSTGMVFVRCRDGLSHHPEEYVDDEAIGDGARLFLEAVIQLDSLL
jgi:allantoate deiminase